eukprot:CAMPEP_0201111248 /NCGR_PEP_ID=MMETSP0812-20130820/73973_1 /ASSEMBLY_ACC=CAM_ASM_000668 /TAXON_ID=98059 /ORGANISM="Dinobryon sp., Strain UTEXLB2267" /LENGTH=102 /DNA_ID=CAMNT_0047374119 /DNA_START=251 /DNA_END=556 /DNA_ORIENTATION=+
MSAEMSNDFSAPRWTPPIPPVAKTEISAMFAILIVLATVVAADNLFAQTYAKSRIEAFLIAVDFANRTRSTSSKPIFTTPSIIAIVAGTEPNDRTIASTSLA